MSDLKCDPYYTLFCYRNGYKIRLSPKLGRGEEFIAEYITDYGSEDMLDPECSRLIEFHNFYVWFSKTKYFIRYLSDKIKLLTTLQMAIGLAISVCVTALIVVFGFMRVMLSEDRRDH